MSTNSKILSICRALGIVCEKITEPYWNVASDMELSPIDMGHICYRLIEFLEQCVENTDLLLNSSIRLLEGPENKPSRPSSHLFVPDASLDDFTLEALYKFVCSMLEKSKNLFKDFLENGIYFSPSDKIILETKSCPSNNISVERLFAKVDNK